VISAGFRLFYVTVKGNALVLLHGYKKQLQKAPKKEIAIAEK
jgi:phage-related protein